MVKSNQMSSVELRRFMMTWTSVVGLAVVTACSGSSGDGGADELPNTAPVFASDQSITVEENTFVVATASATDADGDVLTYSISGDDAAVFVIDANSGELAFASPPDFEAPTDLNADNIYIVTVQATDFLGASDTITYTVTVSDVMETRYLDQVFSETTITEDIVYATTDGQDYFLNVITPVGDEETDRPLILFASGGAFIFTEKDQVIPFATNFAETGYVAAVMDYRTSGGTAQDALEAISTPGALDPAELSISAVDATHDMFAAIRFLKANAATYGFNPDLVFVGGTSGGGLMSAMVATIDPDDPIAPSIADYMASVGGVYGEIGDNLDQSPDVKGALPISGGIYDLFTIDSDSAPIYGAHNELDPVAPCYTVTPPDVDFSISGTCDFVTYYQALGVPAESFIVLGDTGHVDFTNEEYAQIFAESRQLFFTTVIEPEQQ